MTRSLIARIAVGAGLVGIAAVTIGNVRHRPRGWTPAELAALRSLSRRSLEPIGPDASNRYADDARAAALGRDLFFDTRLSGNGKVSCATCHVATQDFQDSKPLADGVGTHRASHHAHSRDGTQPLAVLGWPHG